LQHTHTQQTASSLLLVEVLLLVEDSRFACYLLVVHFKCSLAAELPISSSSGLEQQQRLGAAAAVWSCNGVGHCFLKDNAAGTAIFLRASPSVLHRQFCVAHSLLL
jgi:hypothetical protein